jgi:hypothetical protein
MGADTTICRGDEGDEEQPNLLEARSTMYRLDESAARAATQRRRGAKFSWVEEKEIRNRLTTGTTGPGADSSDKGTRQTTNPPKRGIGFVITRGARKESSGRPRPRGERRRGEDPRQRDGDGEREEGAAVAARRRSSRRGADGLRAGGRSGLGFLEGSEVVGWAAGLLGG